MGSVSQSFLLSLAHPAVLSPLTLSPLHQVLCQSIFHSVAHTASCSVGLSLFQPLPRCSVSQSFTLSTTPYVFCQSFTLSATQPAVLSVSFSLFHALSQVTNHPASHLIITCVIAITVTIGTAALIAAAVRQFDTAPNRYSNKNPRCTNVPATEPLVHYIIMQFTFRINCSFYWRHYN
jgi:uncharacterized membrane protein